MIIKCQKIHGSQTFDVTVGKEYVVLGIKVIPKKGVEVIILRDKDNYPILIPLLGFEVTAQPIPIRWNSECINGIFYRMPKSWMDEIFLNNKYDKSDDTMVQFYKEAELTYQEAERNIDW